MKKDMSLTINYVYSDTFTNVVILSKMSKIHLKYTGDLRTTCTHLKSTNQFITDAPLDNNGKGESFSPTDLLATAYASCMLTIIGIFCDKQGLEFANGQAEVIKIMVDNPRRIGALQIKMDLSGNIWSEKEQQKIIKAALACPVAKSVSSEIEVDVNFEF